MAAKYPLRAGLYVVRLPHRQSTSRAQRLVLESRPFDKSDEMYEKLNVIRAWTVEEFYEYVHQSAQNWADFIQSQYPKDDVFVIERKP